MHRVLTALSTGTDPVLESRNKTISAVISKRLPKDVKIEISVQNDIVMGHLKKSQIHFQIHKKNIQVEYPVFPLMLCIVRMI